MFKTFFAASALLLTGLSLHAAPAAKPAKAPLVCPVTGDTIASAKAAVGHSTYQGKTYYFCCADCKSKFDKNPAKYIKAASAGAKKSPAKM